MSGIKLIAFVKGAPGYIFKMDYGVSWNLAVLESSKWNKQTSKQGETSLSIAWVYMAFTVVAAPPPIKAWWCHQMKTFSALLALCAGNSPVTGEFPSQRSVTRSFNVFFDLWLNKRSSKQARRRWFETPSRSLWCHCNDNVEKFMSVLQWTLFLIIALYHSY